MSSDADHAAPVGDDAGPALLGTINMRRGGLWVAAVIAAAGLVFLLQATPFEFGNFSPAPLSFGTLSLPGPGFAPLVLSLLTIGLAGIIAVREWLRADTGETVALGHRDVLIVFIAMLAVPPLFEPLGAYLTLGLFGAVILVLVARTPVVIAVGAAAVGMVGCWYFFQVALGLQLPIGAVLERMGL
jgi:hypothetical protein